MNKKSLIFIAGGHSGLVGTAIVRLLNTKKYTNLIIKSRKELDLLNFTEVESFFSKYRPEYVFLAAAKVGGIIANKNFKADFVLENLQIQNNVIYNAWKYKTKKLLFLGSSCIYPKFSKQPIKEEYFMTGKLEETNDSYAIAKIAGIKLCQSFNDQYNTNFISVMPTNLYGPNDNFDLHTSHVLPAMIRKIHEAKVNNLPFVTMWGDGTPRREFLHVDDLANACLFLMDNYNKSEIINVGCGTDLTIKSLALLVNKIVGYRGAINWDSTKPNGMPRKKLDISKITDMGWFPTIEIEDGIKSAYTWYLDNQV